MADYPCGDMRFVEGGVIEGGVINNSQINNSVITGSTFTSGSITNLASIDAASALIIANAIASLSKEQLKNLAEALLAALDVSAGTAPPSTDEDPIPTTYYGDRSAALGAPDIWDEHFAPGYRIPLYRP